MNILEKIVAFKKKEIRDFPSIQRNLPQADRNFLLELKKNSHRLRKAVDTRKVSVIAEIKPASPVKGRILPKNFNVSSLAVAFEKSGISAISILTDSEFFQGSFENLRKAKESTIRVPILCKDFILSEKQIRFARSHGADTFLLIVKILSVRELKNLIAVGRSYGMEPLVEIADEEDLQKLLQTDAKIVGINNRDLRDFSVDISRTFRLSERLSKDCIVVSLSGFSGENVRLVRGCSDAILVGSGIGKKLMSTEYFTLNTKNQKIKDVTEAESSLNMNNNIVHKIVSDFTHPNPFFKFCGVRTKEDFEKSKRMNVPFLGLNFVPSSKRKILDTLAEYICGHDETGKMRRQNISIVGVFQNQSRKFVLNICSKYNLDFVQLSGAEGAEEFSNFPKPIIKGISMDVESNYQKCMNQWGNTADIFLFDGKNPGSGESWVKGFVKNFQSLGTEKPFFVAGGINFINAQNFLSATGADGVDVASGIENEKGEWDENLMNSIVQSLS